MARRVAEGEDHRAALRGVAADLGIDIAEARSAARFQENDFARRLARLVTGQDPVYRERIDCGPIAALLVEAPAHG